jgi:hypothetical protein
MNISEQLLQDLRGPFDLSAERKRETIYFRMDTQYIRLGFNGKRTGTETYILKLRCIPDTPPGRNGDQYTCSEFMLQVNNEPAATIPALKDWTYGFNPTRPLFGIPQSMFETVTDSLGNSLHFSIRYAIYDNFLDFHMLNDLFALPMIYGHGIQDINTIGQRVVHAASFIEAPVKMGTDFKPGSIFRNGEVTLELKGISIVDGVPCALVGCDSGESILKMIMPLAKEQESITEGGSEYEGDIYIDLATRWVRKATLDEFVVTETAVPDSAKTIESYTVRHIVLRLIDLDEFKRKLPILPQT